MDASVIIASHNEGRNLKNTIDSIIKNTNFKEYEIIVVDDASTDKSTKFLNKTGYRNVKLVKSKYKCPSKARNIGAKIAKGGVFFFLDAHIFPATKYWMADMYNFVTTNKKCICGPCITAHNKPESKGYGSSVKGLDLGFDWLTKLSETPYEVPIVGAACLAISKNDFFDIGGFNDNFLSWGYDDIELCIRAWLLGYKVFVLPNVEVFHIFRKTFPYNIKNDDINYNLLVTYLLHFNHRRLNELISKLSKETNIDQLFDFAKKTEILRLRKSLIEKRIHNDDWFFDKFGIKIN